MLIITYSPTIYFIECLLFPESSYRKDERVVVNTLPRREGSVHLHETPLLLLRAARNFARKFAVQVNEACVNTRYLMTSGTA